MTDTLPAGPYKNVETGEGTAPWYIVPFDKDGLCTAPLTRAALIETVKAVGYTDLFLFSHGWNNDWETSSARYEDFIGNYIRMRGEQGLTYPSAHRPLLVGIFWPSTALVLPWEQAPKFAAGGDVPDAAIGEWQRELADVSAELQPALREEFHALTQERTLDDTKARRLAEILATVGTPHADADAEPAGDTVAPLSADQLLAQARHVPRASGTRRKPGDFGFATRDAAGPAAAFSVGDLDPRNLVRLFTVRQMKDRAGRVGASGVASLLRDLALSDEQMRIHLVGHSYGAIVVLSALCTANWDDRPLVDTALLLQPAVNQWCFAERVAGTNVRGGYRSALTRSRAPIFTTFTRRDQPLTRFFHLALTRERDLGQPQAAPAGDLPTPPSRYAALGGYGPAGLDEREMQVLDLTPPKTPLPLRTDPPPRVCALRADDVIMSHGDISVPATWWALYQQVAVTRSATT